MRTPVMTGLIFATLGGIAAAQPPEGLPNPPGVDPHPPAINTAWCNFHGTSSPFSTTYADFESSLVGPRGNGNRTIQSQVELHQVGGASVAIIEDGVVTQFHWYGCRDRKANARTTASTIYTAASLSKFVAAIGLVHADRHGELSLDDDMSQLADDFPDSLLAEWVDDKFRGDDEDFPPDIPVRRLLNHTAGLDTHGIGTWEPGDVPVMRDVLMGSDEYPGGVEPLFGPGSTYEYSGGGFIVAEHVLELHVPETFKGYLDAHVFDNGDLPLSTFEKATTSMSNLTRGCSRSSCSYGIRQTNVKAAGGLLANVREYAEIVAALVNGGQTENGSVMTQGDIDTILTPAANMLSTWDVCASPGDTRDFYVDLPFIGPVYAGLETCVAGKWRLVILDGDDWYGLGVGLSTSVESDGFPRTVSHGGDSTGAHTYFKIDRRTGDGLVVMVNGVESWVDGDGFTFGSDILRDEIIDAYNAAY